MKKLLLILMSFALLVLCGCTAVNEQGGSIPGGEASVNTDFIKDDSEMFKKKDLDASFSENDAEIITLTGNGAESSSDTVKISGSAVKITGDATYIISGTLSNGALIIDTDKDAKPCIVLNGVNITSETSAALYVKAADKVIITLAPNSVNLLSNGGSFKKIDENDIDAAVFSKEDITFNGSGSLEINSPLGHGITSKDDLVFAGGNYKVTSKQKCLDANDSIRITDASFELVSSEKDGIHAEHSDDAALGFVYIASGSFKITSLGDCISASSSVQINGGSFLLTSRGKGSYSGSKGIKATDSVAVSGGDFVIDCYDDAIHSNNSVVISAGSLEITTGDDGVHADESLVITGGTVNIAKSYEGLEALNVKIEGGNVSMVADDDGINAAGGNDGSGFGGGFGNDHFGGGGRPGKRFGSANSNGSIVISGGTVYIEARGDGIDANGTLSISGGHITVCGPTTGDTATLDFDVSGEITGGTFIGTGASTMMAQSFSSSVNGLIAGKVQKTAAGTQIVVKDKAGNVLIDYAPALDFAVIILTTPEMVSGESYTLIIGNESMTVTAQ